MNNELIARAREVVGEVYKLKIIIKRCNKAIEEIEHGAEIKIESHDYAIDMSECKLDDGQETLMQQLLIGILRNRMEEAETELELLLPPPMKGGDGM